MIYQVRKFYRHVIKRYSVSSPLLDNLFQSDNPTSAQVFGGTVTGFLATKWNLALFPLKANLVSDLDIGYLFTD